MLLKDDFEDARSPGNVIGTNSLKDSRNRVRQGADAEKTLSIDNSALRISPLITPGWQRSGIAYGPYERQAGLAFSVFLLNGHNASEGNTIEEGLKGRFFRWLRGSETDPIIHRLGRWVSSKHHQHRLWHFYRWIRNHKKRFDKDQHIKENLMLGWFSEAIPADPKDNSIVIRTAGPDNGELCASVNRRLLPALTGLQNLQVYYVVVLREKGAAYYASTLANARGLSAYPFMRLMGIDTHCTAESMYAGCYQAALGQVGFRTDSRVYGIRADVISDLANWYGTAHMADTLLGSGDLAESNTNTSEVWKVSQGSYERTDSGALGTGKHNLALINTGEKIGAIHVRLQPVRPMVSKKYECALLWRTRDENNTWAVFFTDRGCQLKLRENEKWSVIESSHQVALQQNTHNELLILDDGVSFSLYLAGALIFSRHFAEKRLQSEVSVGILSRGATAFSFQNLEVHPREILMPPELRMGQPWERKGEQKGSFDDFSGQCDERLEEHVCEAIAQPWQKTIGCGTMLLTGKNAVKVDASLRSPNPKRLAYTLPWHNPTFADVSVDIRSPGTKRHEGHKGRGGLIFWQNAANYLIVNHWLDDTFDGSAMSAFITIDGYEEVYDGVWANLGKRIAWGEQRRHRVAFDGLNFVVYVEEEPVLYRSIRDVYPQADAFLIHRIGIVANWEWGDDTGSQFSNFTALF